MQTIVKVKKYNFAQKYKALHGNNLGKAEDTLERQKI